MTTWQRWQCIWYWAAKKLAKKNYKTEAEWLEFIRILREMNL